METETFIVSKDQLENDIYWTEIEIKAYKCLYDGYLMLSQLPEIDPFVSRQHYMLYEKFLSFWQGASDLLGELYLELKSRENPS